MFTRQDKNNHTILPLQGTPLITELEESVDIEAEFPVSKINFYDELKPYMDSMDLSMNMLEDYFTILKTYTQMRENNLNDSSLELKVVKFQKHFFGDFSFIFRMRMQKFLLELSKSENFEEMKTNILEANHNIYENYMPIIEVNYFLPPYAYLKKYNSLTRLNTTFRKEEKYKYVKMLGENDSITSLDKDTFYIKGSFKEEHHTNTGESKHLFSQGAVYYWAEKAKEKKIKRIHLGSYVKLLPELGETSDHSGLVDKMIFLCGCVPEKNFFFSVSKKMLTRKKIIFSRNVTIFSRAIR